MKSSKDREAIAKEALGQQSCRVWYDVRQRRITASQCKRCIPRPTASPTKAVEEVLLYGANVQTKAIKEGIEWEPRIIEIFMKETGHQVRKSGFVLSESHKFLGASPDGITEEDKLVEVKKVVYKKEKIWLKQCADSQFIKKMGMAFQLTIITSTSTKYSSSFFVPI